jgi:hypothetical protein
MEQIPVFEIDGVLPQFRNAGGWTLGHLCLLQTARATLCRDHHSKHQRQLCCEPAGAALRRFQLLAPA